MPGNVKRECPVCGIIYDADPTRLKFGRQLTCSRECSYEWRGNKRKKRVSLTCATCGTDFTRSPAQVKSKHGSAYCSRACQYLGRTLGLTLRIVARPYVRVALRNPEASAKTVATRKARDNYRHSDETRARLREATARAMTEGRVRNVSKLEDEVAEVLDIQGIGYRRQVGVRGELGRYVACADFMLDDGRILEVNGTFWHADPRVYPDGPVYPSQVRTARQWARKTAALEKLRIPLLVIWELDFRDNPAEAVRVALSGA